MQFVAPMLSCFLLKVKFSPIQISETDLKKYIFDGIPYLFSKFVKIRPNKKKLRF